MSLWQEPPQKIPAARREPRYSGSGHRNPSSTRSRFGRLLLPLLLSIAATACGCSEEIDRSDEFGLDQGGGRVEVIVLDSSGIQYGETPKSAGPVKGEGDKPSIGPAGSDGSTRTSTGSTEDEDGRQGLLAGAVAYEPDGEFTVQVGVYSDVLKAGERVAELSALGYPAYVIAQPDGKGFRVRIGYFGTREDARAFGDIFSEDHGSDFWIDRRVNEL